MCSWTTPPAVWPKSRRSKPDGRVPDKKTYRHGTDEQGRQIAVVAATEDGALTHAKFSFYDGRGVLTESVEFSGSAGRKITV
jgi:hypothetical protein